METGKIIKLTSEHTLVLNKNGEFIKLLPQSGHEKLGQEVSFVRPVIIREVRSRKKYARTFISAVIVAAMFFVAFFASAGTTEVHAYVSVDINPSVEFSVDNESRIVGVFAYNEEGEMLLSRLNLIGGKLCDGVKSVIEEWEAERGLLLEGKVNLTTSFIHENSSSNTIQKLVDAELEKIKVGYKEYEINTYRASKYLREQSYQNKVSPYKMALILSLENVNSEYSIKNIGKYTVKDLETVLEENGRYIMEKEHLDMFVSRTKEMDGTEFKFINERYKFLSGLKELAAKQNENKNTNEKIETNTTAPTKEVTEIKSVSSVQGSAEKSKNELVTTDKEKEGRKENQQREVIAIEESNACVSQGDSDDCDGFEVQSEVDSIQETGGKIGTDIIEDVVKEVVGEIKEEITGNTPPNVMVIIEEEGEIPIEEIPVEGVPIEEIPEEENETGVDPDVLVPSPIISPVNINE